MQNIRKKIIKLMKDEELLSIIEEEAGKFGWARRKDFLDSDSSVLSLYLDYSIFWVRIEQSQDHCSSDPPEITITFKNGESFVYWLGSGKWKKNIFKSQKGET